MPIRAGVGAGEHHHEIRVRPANRCRICARVLQPGERASYDPTTRTVTCAACASTDTHVSEGLAGASALREYDRRRARRERAAREKFGRLGRALVGLTDEPHTTRVWKQGGEGEVRTAQRLAKHLNGRGVLLLHDRRIKGHGQANIDHLAVGAGGVTVIDSKTHHGPVSVERVGGLFSPRRSELRINGRDQTELIDGVEDQIEYVRAALAKANVLDVDVRGALCFPHPDGLPLFGQLRVRGIIIDGPRPVAKLAARPGALSADVIQTLWRRLDQAFPPA